MLVDFNNIPTYLLIENKNEKVDLAINHCFPSGKNPTDFTNCLS